MHIPLLQDILILLGFAVVIVFLLQRVRLPSILGFLITGVIIGPYGFSLVEAMEEVEILAEIGVILLLFVIGMELSLKQLALIRKTVFIGGFLQVGLTAFVSGGAYWLLGNSWNTAVFVGFLFSLSSTAIVLKVLQDRNEISAPHGRNALGILIFQDIIVVPMMLVTPILAGQSGDLYQSIGILLLKTFIVLAIAFVGTKYIVPRVMHLVARSQSKDLFLLATLTLCFAVAFLTSEAGLSLALGAFLAGLIISESEFSHQATSVILPFRELFTSFFFISVGMLLDIHFFLENVWIILLIIGILFIVKSILGSLAVIVLKYPPRTVLLTGLSLFQVGEFAFILSKVGIQYGLLTDTLYQYFLSVSILSMILTPFVIIFSERITATLLETKVATVLPSGKPDSGPSKMDLEGHLVIIGYGINGTNLSRAAQQSNIPYVVIELNPGTVKREKKRIPILYGDATHIHILKKANVIKARAVVIAISDPKATKTIIGNVRSISHSLYLVVRTRYVSETTELLALGADEVIPEEFETSIEIFSRVLHNFLVPIDDIHQFAESIRSDNYHLFEAGKRLPSTFNISQIPNLPVTCIRVNKDSGNIIGHSLADSKLRQAFGISIIAIDRKGEMKFQIAPEDKIHQNDLLFVHGEPQHIEQFHRAVS